MEHSAHLLEYDRMHVTSLADETCRNPGSGRDYVDDFVRELDCLHAPRSPVQDDKPSNGRKLLNGKQADGRFFAPHGKLHAGCKRRIEIPPSGYLFTLSAEDDRPFGILVDQFALFETAQDVGEQLGLNRAKGAYERQAVVKLVGPPSA